MSKGSQVAVYSKVSRGLQRAGIFLLLILLTCKVASADTIVWGRDPAKQYWFDSKGWIDKKGPAHVPLATDDVLVDFDYVRILGGIPAVYRNLVVGYGGEATLGIDGDLVGTGAAALGFKKGSKGKARIFYDVVWKTEALVVGVRGEGLVEAFGGLISTQTTAIGVLPGSLGNISFGSGKLRTETLGVGIAGKGQMSLANGANEITSTISVIGAEKSGNGEVSMFGGKWDSDSILVGDSGRGALGIHGGVVTAANGYIGYSRGGRGSVELSSDFEEDEAGKFVVTGTALDIGHSGNGSLTVSDGFVITKNSVLGFDKRGKGTATMVGGKWTTDFDFIVGNSGSGTLNVAGFGVLEILEGRGTIILAQNPGSKGVLNMGIGGVVGTLNAAGVTSGDGDAFVNFNHGGNLVVSQLLSGSLRVNQLGKGTTILVGENSYTGDTIISRGVLQLGDNGSAGSIASGRVINKGVLAFNRADTLNFGAVIQGKGGVQQIGSGTLTLTGANKFQGTTTITGGRLEVGHAMALGKGEVHLLGGALATDGLLDQIVIGRGLTWDSSARIALTLDPTVGLSAFVKVGGGVQRLGEGILTFDFSTGGLPEGESTFLVMTARKGFGDLTTENFGFVSDDPGLSGSFRIEKNILFFDGSHISQSSETSSFDGGTLSAVPEPSSQVLVALGVGLGSLVVFRRRSQSSPARC